MSSQTARRSPSNSFDVTNDELIPFQTTIKQLLQARIFLGDYQERRYVELLNEYRDVILISNSETDLKETLDTVVRRIREHYHHQKYWIGITNPHNVGAPPNHHCLWVEVPNIPFGKYWFQIKTVRFRSNEILCKLKCVRPMSNDDLPFQGAKKASTINEDSQTTVQPDWNIYLEDLKRSTNENLYYFFTQCLTLKNTFEILKFLCILLISLATGLISSVRYIGDFSLKFMREFSYFVHASTPIFLGIIDLIAKMIGGLYILIAMMWKGKSSNTNIQSNLSYRNPSYRSIKY